jgi:hypothetical protein
LEFTGFPGFTKSGIVSIFQHQNIEDPVHLLLNYVRNEILPDVGLMLSNSPDLAAKIIAFPERYRYPAVQVIYNTLVNSTLTENDLKARIMSIKKMRGSRSEQVDEALVAVKGTCRPRMQAQSKISTSRALPLGLAEVKNVSGGWQPGDPFRCAQPSASLRHQKKFPALQLQGNDLKSASHCVTAPADARSHRRDAVF